MVRTQFSDNADGLTERRGGKCFQPGQVVRYRVDPEFTVGNEPSGPLVGMIMDSKGLLASGVAQVLVCPLLPVIDAEDSDDDDARPIPYTVPHPDGRRVFRPDLVTSLGISLLQPDIVDGKPSLSKFNAKRAILESR